MNGPIAIHLVRFAMSLGFQAPANSVEEFAIKIRRDLFCKTVSVKEAARTLNVCPHTIYRMIKRADVFATCVNPSSKRKTYRISLAEIARLQQNVGDSTQAPSKEA